MTATDTTILIDKLSSILTHQGCRLATAESCTGGMIAAACTGRAGSSEWFNGGVVTYANELKVRLLNVPESLIETHGAVSEAVVMCMAASALKVCSVQATIAVSGIAGPTGGTKEKPVGTVWIAWAFADPKAKDRAVTLRAKGFCFPGDRDAVRRAAVCAGLQGMVALLEGA